MINSIKNISIKLKKIIITNKVIILMTLPFFAMDIFTRAFGLKISYFPIYYPAPNIFTLLWIVFFMGIVTSLKGIAGKILYWIFFILSFGMFLTNTIYYSLTGFYFSFNLTKLADEGSSYILDTIVHTNPVIYIFAVIVLVYTIIVAKKYKKYDEFRLKRLLIFVVVFVILHLLAPLMFGHSSSRLKWNNFKKPRSVYENYSDSNKSMRISGLYEYSVRNFYFTFLKPKDKISKEDKKFLDDIYNAKTEDETNSYTGLFKDKNVIFLQLEGMDTWLLSKENTPNLYNLLNHSINFTDHYSIYTGGGSTFNSEFAVNAGFTTPISYTENVYTFNTNTFDNSMARLFKRPVTVLMLSI